MNLDRDRLKRAAAERAIEFVENGMVLGLGTGSTAGFVVAQLATRVAQGLAIVAIATSERTAAQARRVLRASLLYLPLLLALLLVEALARTLGGFGW